MGRTEQGKINAALSRAKYDKANTKTYSLKFNLATDADIVSKLSTVDNIQGYIKQLIRTDIEHSNT